MGPISAPHPHTERLSPEARSKAIREGCAELAHRLIHSYYAYTSLLAALYFASDYPADHPLVFLAAVVAVGLGMTARIFLITYQVAICVWNSDVWIRLIGVTTMLLSLPTGLLLAHSLVTYGNSNWNFTLMLIWTTGIACGSVASFASNYGLLLMHLMFMLAPTLAATLWIGDLQSRTYSTAIVLLCGFILTHGRRFYATYWQQLVDRFLEADRAAELQAAKSSVERALEAAERANAAKSQFLANMSHEIRTPMHGVLGMADLVLATDLKPSQKEDIITLRDSAQNLLGILNDILDLSKVEAGEVTLEKIPMLPHQVMLEAANTLRATAERKGLLLHHQISGEPTAVLGDPVRLRQVILNLTGNAVKFTQSGSVAVAVQYGRGPDGSAQVKFSVTDTGPGIAPESRERIFDAFSQADSSVSRRFGGTGLGLSISSHFLQLMNSSIEVESRLGEGSCFSFVLSLPVADKRVPPPEPPSVAVAQATRSLRVLLAEDNAVNQKIAQTQLLRLGHSVQIANDGQKAVEACLAGEFDLILMDNQMPNLSGVDATLAIHRNQDRLGKTRTPIVALTADAMEVDRERFLSAGMLGHLAKPFRSVDLARLLEKYSGSGFGSEPSADRASTADSTAQPDEANSAPLSAT